MTKVQLLFRGVIVPGRENTDNWENETQHFSKSSEPSNTSCSNICCINKTAAHAVVHVYVHKYVYKYVYKSLT